MDTLRLGLKFFVNKIKNFIQENMPNGNSDFVTDTILNWEIPFVLVCKKICRQKALSSYFKTKDCYIEPVEKIVGYDYKTGKPDCLQIYSNTFNIKQLKVLVLQGCTRKHDCAYTAATQVIWICLIISIKVSFLEIMNFSVLFFLQFKLYFVTTILKFPIHRK